MDFLDAEDFLFFVECELIPAAPGSFDDDLDEAITFIHRFQEHRVAQTAGRFLRHGSSFNLVFTINRRVAERIRLSNSRSMGCLQREGRGRP